jgi:hypothetical protein
VATRTFLTVLISAILIKSTLSNTTYLKYILILSFDLKLSQKIKIVNFPAVFNYWIKHHVIKTHCLVGVYLHHSTSILGGSGQLHAPATLPQEKDSFSHYSLDRRLGGAQRRSGRCGVEEISYSVGNRTPVVQPAACGYPDSYDYEFRVIFHCGFFIKILFAFLLFSVCASCPAYLIPLWFVHPSNIFFTAPLTFPFPSLSYFISSSFTISRFFFLFWSVRSGSESDKLGATGDLHTAKL